MKYKYVMDLALLSPKNKNRLLKVIKRLEELVEITPKDEPIYFEPTAYIGSKDNYDERTIVAKMAEWEILTAEPDDILGNLLVFTSIDQLKELREALKNAENTKKSALKMVDAFKASEQTTQRFLASMGEKFTMEAQQKAEEAELRRFMLEDYRNKNSNQSSTSSNLPPSYDPQTSTISFSDKTIPIPTNTNQNDLCKVIFETKTNMNKQWSWDEMVEEWGGGYTDKDQWRVVYNAGREVNKKVAIETGVKDLFIVKKQTIKLNPKYLK